MEDGFGAVHVFETNDLLVRWPSCLTVCQSVSAGSCGFCILPKKHSHSEGPHYGGLNLPYHLMPPTVWLLHPVASSGNSFFVLSEGDQFNGEPEPTQSCLKCVRTEGRFRERPILVPTHQQAQKDATSLRRSAAWKRIRWIYHDQWNPYEIDENQCWRFIQAQANSIPRS